MTNQTKVVGVLALGALGIGLYFALRRSPDDESEMSAAEPAKAQATSGSKAVQTATQTAASRTTTGVARMTGGTTTSSSSSSGGWTASLPFPNFQPGG